MVELIYCAAGNARFAQTAIEAGFLYGIQIPGTAYFPVHFADQDWRKPDRARYIEGLRRHQPVVATVLDWEREEQLPEVLGWAEDAATVARVVVVIPKVQGGIPALPHRIAGAEVRLGYSVPTRYGGTTVPLWEFGARPVHLLGGSPQKQMELSRYLNVVSADGNMAQLMAVKLGQTWVPGTARTSKNRWWPKLREVGGGHVEQDVPYECFARSCTHIRAAWDALRSVGGQSAG